MKNSRMSISTAILASALCFFVLGCDDESQKDESAPSITLDNMTPYQVLKGEFQATVTASDDIAVTKVELLADGKVVASATESPFTVAWDTTATADGLINVTVKAWDDSDKSAETIAVQVIVANDENTEVSFADGNSGTISIPDPYVLGDYHKKHHWTTGPDGASKALVMLEFEPGAESDGDWEFTIDVGTGGCPHSGESLATSDVYTTSPVVYIPELSKTLPANQLCFVHFGINDTDHVGESVNYTVRVFNFN